MVFLPYQISSVFEFHFTFSKKSILCKLCKLVVLGFQVEWPLKQERGGLQLDSIHLPPPP